MLPATTRPPAQALAARATPALARPDLEALVERAEGYREGARAAATLAAEAGVLEADIMAHTGHRRSETLRRYIRRGSAFAADPAGRVGL